MIIPTTPLISKSFDVKTITVRDYFLGDGSEKAFELNVYINPRRQRPDVEDMDKKQSIINYLLWNVSFGGLTLRKVPKYEVFENNKKKFVEKECIDGGHRTRASKEFFNNEFPTSQLLDQLELNGTLYNVGNKYWDDLHVNVRKHILNHQLSLVVYGKDLTDFEAGIVFNWQNKMSSLNDIEQFNSMDLLISPYIRERSRVLNDGLPSEYTQHLLFKTEAKKGKQFPFGTTIQEADSRLRFQFIMAQIMFWHISLIDDNNKPINLIEKKAGGGYTWETINHKFNDESELWKELNSKGVPKSEARIASMDTILDELHRICGCYNNAGSKDTITYSHLKFIFTVLHQLKVKYGTNNVKLDYSILGTFFMKVFAELDRKSNKLSFSDYKSNSEDTKSDTAYKLLLSFTRASNFDYQFESLNIARDGSVLFKEVFGDDMNHFDNIDLVKLAQNGIIVTPKTSPNKSDIHEMWVDQDYKCAIDGEFCKLEDMDYGHTDVPRSMGIASGAETSKDTNALVFRKWNTLMGGNTIEEFRNSMLFKESPHITKNRLTQYERF
jgi:hypothetical protein